MSFAVDSSDDGARTPSRVSSTSQDLLPGHLDGELADFDDHHDQQLNQLHQDDHQSTWRQAQAVLLSLYRYRTLPATMRELAFSKMWTKMSLIPLYSILVLSTSVFIYMTIYSRYVPIVQHTRPVHLQFDSTCKDNCSNPFAILEFADARSSAFYLARGQSYRFVIALEMPESDANWRQGMFMIRLKLLESHGKTLYDTSRPTVLKYKTFLTRLIQAVVFWPFLVTNYRNEMQTMNVQLIDNYIEGARFYFHQVDRAYIEILARDVQIYSAHLRVLANLSGLSYYMYHWPVFSAVLGVSTMTTFIAILIGVRKNTS